MFTILTDTNFRTEVIEDQGCVLVEIGADWCGASHIMKPVLEALALRHHKHLKIGRLDADQHPEVPMRYGVWHLPTFLFFKRGQLVDRCLGAVSQKALESQLLKLFKLEHNHV